MEMLVTRGLNELKLLDSKITDKIEKSNFVCAAKISSNKANGKVTKADFMKASKADFESIGDLIARRDKIKSAIVCSNATTKVTICNIEMTVAEAIERKNTMYYYEDLLEKMVTEYNSASSVVEKENQKVDNSVENLINTAYGKDSKNKISESDYANIAGPYKEANEYGIVDPINIAKEISNLDNFIKEFKSEVDTVLQVSNSTTLINIE